MNDSAHRGGGYTLERPFTMDIYETWLNGRFYYATHLGLWIGPLILLQWLGFRRLLAANWRPILFAPLIVGLYLSATDVVAVAQGVWYFDNPQAPGWNAALGESRNLGWTFLGVPFEEAAFFYLTALLVTQSFILFLPARLRWNPTKTA
ncbi:MAG: lycopene cyclase domain-containing protein [Opitutales bacterium]